MENGFGMKFLRYYGCAYENYYPLLIHAVVLYRDLTFIPHFCKWGMNVKVLRYPFHETIRTNQPNSGDLFNTLKFDISTFVLDSCNLADRAVKSN